jgi:hypothetical protein
MVEYQKFIRQGFDPSPASQALAKQCALAILIKFKEVLASERLLSAAYRETVYQWLKLMPGYKDPKAAAKIIEAAIERKKELNLV